MTGLARRGERPADTLRRLERLPASEYVRLMGTEDGQRLLEAVRRDHIAARREGKRDL